MGPVKQVGSVAARLGQLLLQSPTHSRRSFFSCSKMKSMCHNFIGALVVFIAVNAVVEAQQSVTDVSEQEIRNVLATRASATNVVDCLIRFVEGKCDRRLEDIEQNLPTLIRRHFEQCRPPRCTPRSQSNVRVFVRIMQQKYPDQWRRLITNARRR